MEGRASLSQARAGSQVCQVWRLHDTRYKFQAEIGILKESEELTLHTYGGLTL